MSMAIALKRQYGEEKDPPLSPMYWCSDCGCVSALRVVMPDHSLACPVCMYEEEKARQESFGGFPESRAHQPQPAAHDICAQQRHMYRYKRSERAFKDFLLEVKDELSEDEFVEMCRDYYLTDW